MACGGCAQRQRLLAGTFKRAMQQRPPASQVVRRVAVVAQHLARDIRRSTVGIKAPRVR